MFTGIIEEVGKIKSITKKGDQTGLVVSAIKVLADTKIGDSIAVNGTCLTVTHFKTNEFSADVMNETVNRSSFQTLKIGSLVNLERAMQMNARLGGHMVAGHVDGTGLISKIKKDANAVWLTITCEPSILKYIIEKGSITIDGISLTVAKVSTSDFSVSLIPHTLSNTNLHTKKVKDLVNLENDLIGKYVEKLLFSKTVEIDSKETKSQKVTKDFLQKHGY
ncbi:riboflavin synthase [[Mycoplasma] testudinis]|uniref:riboflavin synthase n=1 Tax=[Mycoplasma] testudinis TaxID=33924 RepID=UPI000487B4B3|nr:riboflavin synthase [[Mycoplasma] testudinis]